MLFYRDCIPKHVLPQLIEAAIIVVPDTSEGLAEFLTDLRERIALEEVEAQSLALVLRKRLQHLFQSVTPKNGFGGIIVVRGRYSDHLIGITSDFFPGVKLARGEMAAPLDGPVVCHLNNPGAGCAFRAVEDPALALEKKKQVLNEILRLRRVPQDASGNGADDCRVTVEELPQRLQLAVLQTAKQNLVADFERRAAGRPGITDLFRERQRGEARRRKRAQINSFL